MTGQASLRTCLLSGVVAETSVRWARLHFGGCYQRWHAIATGLWAVCGHQNFDYPDVEYSDVKPESTKVCKSCLARLARSTS